MLPIICTSLLDVKGHALLDTFALGGAVGAISRLEGGLIIPAPLQQPLKVDASDNTLVWIGCAKGPREHVVEVPPVPFEILSIDADMTRLPNRPPAVERLRVAQRAEETQVSSADHQDFTRCALLRWGQGSQNGGLDIELLLVVLSVHHVRPVPIGCRQGALWTRSFAHPYAC